MARQELDMAPQTRSRLSVLVVKTLALFSGVQIVNILCSLVRAKLVSLWLGPVGIGLFGLFTNAFDTLSSLFQLGLRTSAVRDVAAARHDGKRIAVLAFVVKRWAWVLGVVGALVTIIFSPLLSRVTFGDTGQAGGFIVLSAAVFFASVTNSRLVILQGLERYKRLASASMWGSVAGLVLSIPMFYWLGINSIVPSIVVYAAAGFLFSWIYRVRLPKPEITPSVRQTWREGVGFIRLGIFLTISTVFMFAANYVFTVYLNWCDGTAGLGYYQAGYTIVTRYMGLVFTAIVMEYYPRLVTVLSSRMRTGVFVSHEMTLGIAVIVPVATLMMIFDDTVLSLLYNSRFEVAAGYLNWSLAGTVLRAVSWCMAVEILARGDGKVYVLTELLSAVLFVILSIAGNELGGLTGIGIAYFVWYASYTLIVGVVYFRRYRLRVNRQTLLMASASALLLGVCAFMRSCQLRWPLMIVAAVTATGSVVIIRRLLRR